jgi:hypothetical protein
MTDIDGWLKSGKYLPQPLRDFHDQKDTFKAIHQAIDVKGHDYCKSVDWMAAHCYVIDIFLWYMARRGYTLQRSRQRLPFRDLEADVKEQTDKRNDAFARMLNQHIEPTPGPLPAEGDA